MMLIEIGCLRNSIHENLCNRYWGILTFILISISSQAQPYAYFNSDDSTITKVDVINCQTTILGNTKVFLEDIAFCPNRKFYGVGNNQLYAIDTLTATATQVLTLASYSNLVGLACDSLNFVYAASQKGQIIKIDPQLLTYSITSFINQGCDGDITFLHDTLYDSAPNATLIEDTTTVGQMSNLSHVLGLATLFYDNPFGLPNVLLSTQHTSLWITSPKNAFSAPLCNNISQSCIRGATAQPDTNGYHKATSLFKYIIPTEIEMPNVFSPNNDGFNDKFVPIVLKGPIFNITLEIINRWGVSIFKTNDLKKGWDGSQNGFTEAPDGMYFWVVLYSLNDSVTRTEDYFNIKHLNGYVHLKR